MPPGSQVFMSEKSAYITSALFLEWLKTHFVPRKPSGKVLLLLDGHSTHCNSVEMLEYAVANDVILLSIPSHTSHYLQPLDRSVFKSLKSHFYEQCRLWIKQNPSRRITRLSFGLLLNNAWVKVASAEKAIAGFKATGVFPFNPSAIPEYAFLTSLIDTTPNPTDCQSSVIVPSSSKTSSVVDPTPEINEFTPSHILKEISPIPQKLVEARKRAKQVGTLLTSQSHIEVRKAKEQQKNAKEEKLKIKKEKIIIKKENKTAKTILPKKRKAIRKLSESSEDEEEPILCDSDNDTENEQNNCAGCGENYYTTQLIEDWLQCTICSFWVHENCTEFDNMCSKCGQKKKREDKNKKRVQ